MGKFEKRHRGDDLEMLREFHVKTEAEVGIMLTEVMKCLRLPEAGTRMEKAFSTSFIVSTILPTP